MDEDFEKLKTLNNKTYREQAIWFLNAYWKTGPCFEERPEEAEAIWITQKRCVELDPRGAEGNELDELKAHILIESLDGAITVREMREALRKVDVDFNRMVSLTEFLVYKYDVKWQELVNAPQGSDSDHKRILEAEQSVEAAKNALDESEEQQKIARENENKCRLLEKESMDQKEECIKAEELAKESEASAKAAAEESKAQELNAIELENVATESEKVAVDSEQKAIEEENQAKDDEEVAKKSEAAATNAEKEALKQEDDAKEKEQISLHQAKLAHEREEAAAQAQEQEQQAEKMVLQAVENIQKEEKAFQDKKNHLKQTSEDMSQGVVARCTAKNELAQLLSKDPMPLQRAKITEESALRKQKKLLVKAQEARTVASAAREEATKSCTVATEQREQAVLSKEQAVEARKEASATLIVATEASKKSQDARKLAGIAREKAAMDLENAKMAKEQASQAARNSEHEYNESQLARGNAETQREQSEQAAEKAAQAKAQAEQSRMDAEQKLSVSIEKFQYAQERMKTIKAQLQGSGQGKLWWMERDLTEKKKFMSRKQLAKLEAANISSNNPAQLTDEVVPTPTLVA